MSIPTKSDQATDLFSLQELAAGDFKAGALEAVVTTKLAVSLAVDIGPTATTASPTATEWRVERKVKDAINRWRSIYARLTSNAVPNQTSVSSGAAQGTNTCVVASATGLAVGQILFFKNATFANSEWQEIIGISGTTLTFLNNFENGQSGSSVFNRQEHFHLELPVTVIKSGLRVVANNNRGTNRTMAIRASWQSLDSID